MSTDRDKTLKNPADIARETFRQLGVQRIAPTPEAYRRLYLQIAGIADEDATQKEKTDPPPTAPTVSAASEAEQLLANFANALKSMPGKPGSFGQRLSKALVRRDWEGYQIVLQQLVAQEEKSSDAPPNIELPLPENNVANLLRDALYRSLALALASMLKRSPPLANESVSLGEGFKAVQQEPAAEALLSRLKQLCFQIEVNGGELSHTQTLLLDLFRLLLVNIHDLLDEDSWLVGQIAVIQNTIEGELDDRALEEATRSLKDVIYKQGVLKSSIAESKSSMKNMMSSFVEKLDSMASRTGDYHDKMNHFVIELQRIDSPPALQHVMHDVLHETSEIRSETLRSRDFLLAAQKEVKEAETRIKDLEDKLAHMSELVREDQLTGSLNRRGFEDVYEREVSRAERRNTPLCAALLDLDNFKKLNDTHGHAAGDEALVHLVRIVKQTLRSIDVIARYGGEEFMILMPETTLEEAAQAMTRVQRELTKHFFVANEERLFITFSAGVALHKSGETQDELIQRTDKAMYQAKRSGKNRVVTAD